MIFALLLLSFGAAADDRTELQELHAAVNALNQEQQALFQQFQMLQELRRANDQASYAAQLRPPQAGSEVPNYADGVQAQKDLARQGEDLAQQANQIYAQYKEIGDKKTQLRQRILELTLSR
ncbi:MAG: hypothetical protein JJE42_09190 [Burkholderiales bacterium]|nr:hypothetical protein [Burkholderiales bacterium]